MAILRAKAVLKVHRTRTIQTAVLKAKTKSRPQSKARRHESKLRECNPK